MNANNSMFVRLKLNLEKFQATNDFDIFGSNAGFFRQSCEDFKSQLKEV